MRKYIRIPIENILNQFNNDKGLSNAQILRQTNVLDWYNENIKTDDLRGYLNEDVTFFDVFVTLAENKDFYALIGFSDSLARENIFKGLSDILNVDYNVIYYLWLNP